MNMRKISLKGCSFLASSLLILMFLCSPTLSKAQNPNDFDDEDYLAKQASTVGQGILQTLANLMVKRNEAVIMGIIQEVNQEKKTIKILNQTVFFDSDTTLLGGTKGLPGIKANQIVIITVQERDSKLMAVEVFKMPKSSRKPF
ncbi:MAG: hypothetical protein HY819_14945 [Acidobacteria bacterium]|nr:hypothetical protein [Acidobacteriota bacterium]